jgi:glycosyltransferase involved in cell wall biosynthesis
MKILHIITRLILGGAQENTLLTVEGLHHRHTDDVILLTGPAEGPEGDLFDRALELGLNVEVLPELVRPIRPVIDTRAYHLLRAAIRKHKPQVVHTHSSKAGILGRAAAWKERVPAVVHTIHGLPFGSSESWIRNQAYVHLERWAATRCHAIVSVCDAMTTQALAAGVGRPEQYSTIYSGMDVDAFLHPRRTRTEVRAELGLRDEHIAFATVARLFERKGHDDLLAVAPRLLRENPHIRFVWIGSGILREQLESEARKVGVDHALIFTGLVSPSRIPELLHACDAVVHPSLREGLARVLPQAYLVGRPAISYDVDGAREVVINNETGFLLRPKDRQGLASAIQQLADNANLRGRFGEAGKRRIANQFRQETMVDQLRALYERVLQAPKRG